MPGPYKFYISAAVILSASFGALSCSYSDLAWWQSILVGINLAAFTAVGFDKKIAGSREQRIPEKVFYGIAALGGSPGMLAGMHMFRHKTKKASFQFALVIIVAVQLIIFRSLHGF